MTAPPEAVWGLVGTILGAAIAAIVQWVTLWWTSYSERRAEIDASIAQMLSYSIQYPALESKRLCDAYPNCADDLEKVRYESYCCFVFNTLFRVWKFCKHDPEKMSEIVAIDEIFKLHANWWRTDNDNLGYHPEFRKFVNGHITALLQQGQLK
jgi:hypothetical protein